MRYLIAALCCLSVLFFAAFGWFCLVRDWDVAMPCLLWAFIAGGLAFVMSAVTNTELS